MLYSPPTQTYLINSKEQKMKDLKKSLEKVASELNKAAKQVEKLADKLGAQTVAKAKPVKKTVAKKLSKKTAKQPAAADTVYNVIARPKNGANMAAIKQKTGYDNKKIHNLVYKLKKQGKIKSETKGVYVKV
jgi:predicted Rossmann fold nucleotide-binding protein DprA/Smf involved in DNA uptake